MSSFLTNRHPYTSISFVPAFQMFRSIIHDKDFEVSLAYESADFLPPGVTSPVFAQYAVSGLANATEK